MCIHNFSNLTLTNKKVKTEYFFYFRSFFFISLKYQLLLIFLSYEIWIPFFPGLGRVLSILFFLRNIDDRNNFPLLLHNPPSPPFLYSSQQS